MATVLSRPEKEVTDSFRELWFDVGGTFTDCFALGYDGSLRRHKLLSSGITKGVVAEAGDRTIVDPARAADPERFWDGYRFRLLDDFGTVVDERTIDSFDRATATFTFDRPLEVNCVGRGYELSSGEESVVVAVRYLLGLRLADPIPPSAVRLGTTRGTNALLTRRGARTAFVTTRGFGDVLRIGYQNRPRLFDLRVVKPEPLYADVMEVDERVAADGIVLLVPDEAAVHRDLSLLRERGVESLAVCLLHAYRFGAHEELIGRIAAEVGFTEVSLSHQVAPLAKIVARGDTTVVDAYLNPVLRDYVRGLRGALGSGQLRIMTSAGGLVAAEQFVGKDSILSGPAGGVVGMARAAQTAGFSRAIGFDMGGTSTDVARFDNRDGGRFEMEYETEKAGVRIVAPMTAVHTVAAGGGSVCWFDGVKLVVGPDSGGADPGPACYGRGGPLCVTDLNFYLGKILPERFPFPLDHAAVERRLSELIDAVAGAIGKRYDPSELCAGFLRVANANMVKAIQAVSVAKGCDPRDYVLVAFGGAAGQHACAVARELGMRQVLSHPDAGLLSAYGIGLADVVRHRVEGVYRSCSAAAVEELRAIFERLTAEARREVCDEGVAPERVEIHTLVDLRYRGVDAALTIELSAGDDSQTLAANYEREHQRLYGYRHSGRALEVVAARVEVIGRTVDYDPAPQPMHVREPECERTVTAYFDGGAQSTQVFERTALRPGDRLQGPAIVCERSATTILDPGWSAEMLARGELLLTDVEDSSSKSRRAQQSTAADPVMLEIFNNQFAAIAEQMGITLRNTSSSVNVKERLDFSCALFTSRGELVVNAPHIPVHLGAMGETVRAILADNPDMRPGDVFVTNDPYRGGSHLPDVTVVTPVHDVATEELLFFTASRAHHAEIGGIRPGSMPPFSKNLAEEGVLIRNFKLVDAGRSRFDELRALLTSGPFPTRHPADNLADIAAQTAADRQGARDLERLIERHSRPVVEAYMQHIRDAAERKMRMALARIPDGRYEFTDHLDDGTPIAAAITIAGDGAMIDFTGTGPVSHGNLNANRAIVTSAVMYVMRCLIDEDIPLNQGVLEPVRIILPECLLNPTAAARAEDCPAVVGGNVETSQRVVDVLLGALGLAAASQGTMNNTLFGDDTFGYYETVCGGNGATPAGPGADAVHTHMTNTRLTDAEVLEIRYPVRVREFSIRRGSGGAGLHRGGDGIVRKLEFLRPLEVSLLTQRRGDYAPYGMNGGSAGALGRNTLFERSGTMRELTGAEQFHAAPGDILVVETPGGGGWGVAVSQATNDRAQ
ncbi:MAG: hydantoinase B/oxoprolinase family protein [Planctomycetia bacterium]|nr:hydantoinase B/oxoprolinase family protein [Planctomycetia bacterium]